MVGGGAAGVADAVAQRQRAGVVLTSGRQIAPFLAGAGERSDGVRLDAQIPDRRCQATRPLQISGCTVELAVFEEPGPDVAEQRGHPRGVAVRRCAGERTSPQHDRGMRPVSSERLDTRPAHAVDRHFHRSACGRPGRKARDLTDEKRVAPCDRIGRGDLARGVQFAASQRLVDRLPHGERPLAHFEDERSLRQAEREQSERVRTRRLQDSEQTSQPNKGHRRRGPAIENAASSDAAHRSKPVRASTFHRYDAPGTSAMESGNRATVSVASVANTTPPVASKTVTR